MPRRWPRPPRTSRHGLTTLSNRKLFTAFAALVYLATVFARLMSAQDLSLWPDEMTSLLFAKGLPWTQLRYDNSPPLFNVLLKFWPARIDQEFGLRLLPCVFYVATPPVLYLAARRAFGPSAAPWALIFGSIQAVLFYHAVDIRPYSLFAFASALNLYAFVVFLEDRRGRIFPFLASIAFLASTHHFAVIPIFAQLFAVTARGRGVDKERNFRVLALWAVLVVLAILALLHLRLDALVHLRFEPRWLALAFPIEVLRVTFSQSFWWLVILGMVLAYPRAPRLMEVLALSLLSTVPIGLATGLNPAQPQYYIFLAPYLAVVLAAATATWRPHWKAFAFAAVALGINVWIIRSHWGVDRAGWKEAARSITPASEKLVILIGHVSLKSPYFLAHRTFFPPPEDQTQDLPAELSPSREVWFLFPDIPRAQDVLDEYRERIFRFGFETESEGIFKADSEFPVRYVKLRRRPEKG